MTLPQVRIELKAAKRIRNFDCWIFRDELVKADAALPAGEVVEVADPRGGFVGYGFWHPTAHIAVRVGSHAAQQPLDAGWLSQRIAEAVARRGSIAGTNAARLVFSEADGVPGLIVDRYADYLVVQFRSAGLDRRRSDVVEILQRHLHPQGILERSDKAFRDEEGLPQVVRILAGEVPERILIEEAGLRFWVDPHHGAKTGFYLDQRTTRERIRRAVQPDQTFLDAFAFTGSLGIAAASRGARVICLEQHEPFLALAKDNAKLNHVSDRIDYVAGDAFYWLDLKANGSERVDWVSLDPPGLAKTKAELSTARRALHHLVHRGLQMLAPDGRLLLSICSYHLLGRVEEIVRIAAEDLRLRLTVEDAWRQAEDHPWILQLPASRYLASWQFARDARRSA